MSTPRPPTPFAEGLARAITGTIAHLMRYLEEYEPDAAKRWVLLREQLELFAK
jgi:hypothetical protein